MYALKFDKKAIDFINKLERKDKERDKAWGGCAAGVAKATGAGA